MSDNSKQFYAIFLIHGNLDILFAEDPNVFVIGDMLWYPVEGSSGTRQAPDVMVIFGRPKGHRGSYLQWREENIAPQVVFEILSPSNRKVEMDETFAFYNRYGVEECYLYDPDRGRLQGWLHSTDGGLEPIHAMIGWHSPRLGIRFGLEGNELRLFYPNGEPFRTVIELHQRMREAEAGMTEAYLRLETALDRSDAAMDRARAAMEWAETEAKQRADAEIRAKIETQRAEVEAQRAEAEAKARAEAEARVRDLEEKLRTAGLL